MKMLQPLNKSVYLIQVRSSPCAPPPFPALLPQLILSTNPLIKATVRAPLNVIYNQVYFAGQSKLCAVLL